MKEEIIFRREEAFKKWLPKNNVVASVSYYANDIRSIQNDLGIDIDKLLEKGIEKALERINADTIKRSKHMIANYRSVLNKYWKFTQAKD